VKNLYYVYVGQEHYEKNNRDFLYRESLIFRNEKFFDDLSLAKEYYEKLKLTLKGYFDSDHLYCNEFVEIFEVQVDDDVEVSEANFDSDVHETESIESEFCDISSVFEEEDEGYYRKKCS